MDTHADTNKSTSYPTQKSTPGGLKIKCEKQIPKILKENIEKSMYFIWLEKDLSNHKKPKPPSRNITDKCDSIKILSISLTEHHETSEKTSLTLRKYI